MSVSKHIFIKGFVQGVSYRKSTKRVATGLGVHGWVRNLSDGNVEAFMEGEESAVDALLSWCAFGPRYSLVEEVQVLKDIPSGTYSDFTILEDRKVA